MMSLTVVDEGRAFGHHLKLMKIEIWNRLRNIAYRMRIKEIKAKSEKSPGLDVSVEVLLNNSVSTFIAEEKNRYA